MMEKKTLLAFALSFVVLIAWSFLFAPQEKMPDRVQQGPGEEKPIASTPKTTGDLSPSARPAVDEATSALQTATVEEKEIVVETDLYQAVLTNAGPTIKSLKLKQYRQTTDPQSPPIEIVGLRQDIGDFLLLGFTPDAGEKGSLTPSLYETDRQDTHVLVTTDPQEVAFKGQTADGLSLTQTLRFYPDSYRIDARIEVHNPKETPVDGSFRTELSALPPSKKGGYYSYVGLMRSGMTNWRRSSSKRSGRKNA